MRGIGFIPDIWVNEAREAGLFPTSRAFIAATVIARAADLDGRWCFLCLDTLVSRSGHLLSLSVAKRAIADLIAAGLVRKLDPGQTAPSSPRTSGSAPAHPTAFRSSSNC
ncbi:hypothetical protein [Nocardiopsis sp. CNS-639]|uniref:hypothetical protein n=1 Tax=Nocardiopsis sp. CNS-639 TaxID=1169153 RepID=UPI0003A7DD09|nr:hypothetical protein [Nocardiopsis sp. CNS-639]